MEAYRSSRERFRQQDATTAALKRSLRGIPKRRRRKAIETATMMPLTPKQREARLS